MTPECVGVSYACLAEGAADDLCVSTVFVDHVSARPCVDIDDDTFYPNKKRVYATFPGRMNYCSRKLLSPTQLLLCGNSLPRNEYAWAAFCVHVAREQVGNTLSSVVSQPDHHDQPAAVCRGIHLVGGRKVQNQVPVPVCIIDENLTVPADRRVWREAKALAEAGYSVSVICPEAVGFQKPHETLEGIEIYRHRSLEGSTLLGHLLEYAWAIVVEFFLALRVYARKRFRIIHACNPPDTIFLIALFFKLFGVRFVFDHHDPTPEFYSARFQRKGLIYRLALLAERLTFRAADMTISTNDTLREMALTRGGVSPESSFVVRTCPDLDDFPPQPPRLELKRGRDYLVLFVGTMGTQDGLDLLLESIEYLIRAKRRDDVLFVLIGDGPEFGRLKAQVTERGLDGCVKFTGGLYGDELKAYLATADVGVAPDPSNVFNDKLTMIKILEYMAYGMPVVLYDLPEGRKSARGAALYARGNDPHDFAEKIAQLLDSKPLRDELGMAGRKRIVEKLNWRIQRRTLLMAYQTALHNYVPSVLGTQSDNNNFRSSSEPRAEAGIAAEDLDEASN